MFRIKNIRPGILVIPDAGLKLNPGQVVEIEERTRKIESALKKGYLALIDTDKPDAQNEPVWFKNSSVSKDLKIHHDFGKNHDEFRLGLKKTHRRGVVDLE